MATLQAFANKNRILLTGIAVGLLLFNSMGALYGGWNLVTHPDGSSLHLAPELLRYTIFQDYLIPGILLLLGNGIFSIIVLALLLFNFKFKALLVTAQGLFLMAWIIIQILLIYRAYPLQVIFGLTGLMLIIIGYVLYNNDK